MAKNVQADALIGPLRVPAFLEEGLPHPLCPVQAFRDDMEHREGVSDDHLFYNSRRQELIPPRALVCLFCHIINIVDLSRSPRVHSGITGIPLYVLGSKGT